jgi:DNA-binding response OmpR family regulator
MSLASFTPAMPLATQPVPIGKPMTIQPPIPQPVPKCILVVDDDDDLREAIAMVLAPRYCVRVAVDGMDGYQKAHDQPRPDLIIADVSMPGLDGITMVRHIRSSDELRRVPVIFFTGQTPTERVIEGLSVGTFAYLSKTCEAGMLEDAVKRALWR